MSNGLSRGKAQEARAGVGGAVNEWSGRAEAEKRREGRLEERPVKVEKKGKSKKTERTDEDSS